MYPEIGLLRSFWFCTKILLISILLCLKGWAADGLPFLSSGNAITAGKNSTSFISTDTQFFGGVSVGSGFVTSTTALTSDDYSTIKFSISVDPADVGEQADLLIVLGEDNQFPYDGGSDTNYFTMITVNENSSFIPINLYGNPEVWIEQLANNPFYAGTTLQNETSIEFGLKSPIRGMLYIFSGYRLHNSGKLVYSANPVMLELSDSEPTPTIVNQSPIATHDVSPREGQAPLQVFLDASLSYDPDGSIVSYQWSVNGQILSGKKTSITFDKAGSYPVFLTVTDGEGASSLSWNYTVVVTQAPIANPMDEIKVTQITDPNTELAFVGTTGKEAIGIFGKKDKDGRLTKVNRIYFGSQTELNKNFSITLGDDYLPKTMEFPDGSQIEFSDYANNEAIATYHSSNGNTVKMGIPLQLDTLYAAVAAIKQYQGLPQPTQKNPVPSRIGNTSSPTDSNCLEVMTIVYKAVDTLFWGTLQFASLASCGVSVAAATLTGGTAIPLAFWACGSVLLSSVDKIAEAATTDKSPFKQLNQGNNLVQGVSSCTIMRDFAGCAQFVASEVIDGALEQFKPENVCKKNDSKNCVSSSSFSYCLPRNSELEQWCSENSGFYFDCTESCITDFGTKEKMLERLEQCQALNGYGEDVSFGRVRCTSTLQWCR